MSDDAVAREQIRWEGYAAASRMTPRERNPYAGDPVKATLWLGGWQQHAAGNAYISLLDDPGT